MDRNKPVNRKDNIVVQEYGKELLIYDLVDHRAMSLNQTSALVWRACNGTNTIKDIAKMVGSEEIALLALDQLESEKLIENGSSVDSKFAGISRREAIRRAGMASMVTLPLITALAAPVAAQAGTCTRTSNGCTGSNRPRGCNCSSNANCASGLTCNSSVSGGTCC